MVSIVHKPMAADAARSAHDADRMSVCRRPVLCGQGNHCDTWSFIRTYSCLARDYIYHPALQVSVAMILNYPNGM